ncbi:hypothetical protein PMAYCL1PPCAC_01928, partial [Pristionchus mayeri]
RISILMIACIALSLSSSDSNSVCPDPRFLCPGKATCCIGPSGSWGCCPYAAATCCEDGLHCCPFGMTCSGSFCMHSSQNNSMEALDQLPAQQISE